MRVTHIRRSSGEPLLHRLSLALHCRYTLDSELSHVDLMTLSRSETRELLLGVERSTGLSTGALAHDAALEDE